MHLKALACLLAVSALLNTTMGHAQQPAPVTTSIAVNGSDTGRTFDGIGALSAGASSRLLIDYPPKQRSEILDYLFKPDFGAALQINKVEIGGGMNSTDGSEPSHMRTPDDQNYSRGYEWWLMQQSKIRNPSIKLYGLEWGAPNWINPQHNDVWTTDNITYLLNWMSHAKSDYGLTMDYMGGWNERGYSVPWYEEFRHALNTHGFGGVRVVADDSGNWDISKDIGDPVFAASFDIIGQHYPDFTSKLTADPKWIASSHTGKTLWASEMGSQPYDTGAGGLAKAFNLGYINGRMTSYINWSTIWSVYSVLPYGRCGLMLADQPWSGHYVVGQSVWVTAHTTQFAQPGWVYLDHACGYLGRDMSSGSFVALKSPDSRDYSVIIETVDAKAAQTAALVISGGLPVGPLHVWRTDLRSANSKDWFVRRPDITPSQGAYSLSLLPGCVYSVTTTTGQHKGLTAPPPSVLLPLPYTENFHEYQLGQTPKYFSDQQGTFETAPAGGGRRGICLRQVVTARPVLWTGEGDPSTVIGDPRWDDYQVTSDVLLEQPGYVDLVGRVSGTSAGNSYVINGYHLRVTDTGHWSLIQENDPKETVLASGTVSFSVNTWHTLSLKFALNRISASIDGSIVLTDFLDDAYSQGLAGYQVSAWQNAEFQNFRVSAVPTLRIPRAQIAASATSAQPGYEASKAIDGDPGTFWHTAYDPAAAPLPQSLILDLGGTYTVAGLTYLPRQDGQSNGRITQYTVTTSRDGKTFLPAASGDWADDAGRKSAAFAPRKARFVRLEAVAGHGGFACAAEVEVIRPQ